MKLFYAMAEGDIRSKATSKEMTFVQVEWAQAKGCNWFTEAEALARNCTIPNGSGVHHPLTPAKTWEVTVKVESGAIWAYWLNKWYALREYRVAFKQPSTTVMEKVERTFRCNSGIPVNHDVKFIW